MASRSMALEPRGSNPECSRDFEADVFEGEESPTTASLYDLTQPGEKRNRG